MIINIDYKLILEKLNSSGIQAKEYKLNLKKGKKLSFTQLAVLCGSLGLSLDEVIIIEDETNIQPRAENKPSFYKDVIDYLNEITNRDFKPVESNIKLIRARLKEGYKKEDFYVVINYQYEMWQGTEWEKYLRPSTLFSAKNFDKYLNSARFSNKKTNKEGIDK